MSKNILVTKFSSPNSKLHFFASLNTATLSIYELTNDHHGKLKFLPNLRFCYLFHCSKLWMPAVKNNILICNNVSEQIRSANMKRSHQLRKKLVYRHLVLYAFKVHAWSEFYTMLISTADIFYGIPRYLCLMG